MTKEEPQEKVIKRRPDGTFKPGSVANPGGRPKGSVNLSTRLKTYMRDNPKRVEQIIETLVKDAVAGDAQARKLLFDRNDGPLALKVEGLSDEEMDRKLRGMLRFLASKLPKEYAPILAEAARECLGSDEDEEGED